MICRYCKLEFDDPKIDDNDGVCPECGMPLTRPNLYPDDDDELDEFMEDDFEEDDDDFDGDEDSKVDGLDDLEIEDIEDIGEDEK
jgi:hypothetical protein